ncbi:cytochrome-c peroxidase [Pseudidiomarina insulisalsae]|uniref:Cytochrome-c peroxidase n=1 Tax=Pseudidiomarina insulisalsae TaxID=575789 RepID=A0A432YLG7_9GAMM|nr:cytochrome c peroxidase [Pseudidiomarina insulisalsae]RUO61803.1 cytochrome-c peroxidase [Pseudidiomarina insulisalsae]
MRGVKFKLTLMTILSLPLLFQLLLVGGALFLGDESDAQPKTDEAMPAPQSSVPPLNDRNRYERLWADYLQPLQHWPELAEGASEDVAALPEPPAQDPAQVQLGKRLFHDAGLSLDGTVSCASCHKSSHAFADDQRVTPGVQGRLGKRNAQSLLDVHLWEKLFWDGRAVNLVQQAHMPLEDEVEMASSRAHAVAHVAANYPGFEDVRWPHIARALAAFQRTLTLYDHPDNRLDQFLRAVDQGDLATAQASLSDQELHGLDLFRTKAGCVRCHNGPLLSDQKFHVTGFHYYGRRFEDLGLWEIDQRIENLGAFRTPMLRGLMQSRPWMHNGLFDNLRGIVRQYGHGGPRPRRPADQPWVQPYPETTDELVPFSLTREEEDALLAFLQLL